MIQYISLSEAQTIFFFLFIKWHVCRTLVQIKLTKWTQKISQETDKWIKTNHSFEQVKPLSIAILSNPDDSTKSQFHPWSISTKTLKPKPNQIIGNIKSKHSDQLQIENQLHSTYKITKMNHSGEYICSLIYIYKLA